MAHRLARYPSHYCEMGRLYTTSGNYAKGKDAEGNDIQDYKRKNTMDVCDNKRRKCTYPGTDNKAQEDTEKVTWAELDKEFAALQQEDTGEHNTARRCTQGDTGNKVAAQEDTQNTPENIDQEALWKILEEDNVDNVNDFDQSDIQPVPYIPESPSHSTDVLIPVGEDFRDIDALFGNDDCDIAELLAFVENHHNCGT